METRSELSRMISSIPSHLVEEADYLRQVWLGIPELGLTLTELFATPYTNRLPEDRLYTDWYSHLEPLPALLTRFLEYAGMQIGTTARSIDDNSPFVAKIDGEYCLVYSDTSYRGHKFADALAALLSAYFSFRLTNHAASELTPKNRPPCPWGARLLAGRVLFGDEKEFSNWLSHLPNGICSAHNDLDISFTCIASVASTYYQEVEIFDYVTGLYSQVRDREVEINIVVPTELKNHLGDNNPICQIPEHRKYRLAADGQLSFTPIHDAWHSQDGKWVFMATYYPVAHSSLGLNTPTTSNDDRVGRNHNHKVILQRAVILSAPATHEVLLGEGDSFLNFNDHDKHFEAFQV